MSNLYQPGFPPGTTVKVVGYNPKNPDPADPDPNGHTGTVEAIEDPKRALSAYMLGLVRVRIPDITTSTGSDFWLLPKELERVDVG